MNPFGNGPNLGRALENYRQNPNVPQRPQAPVGGGIMGGPANRPLPMGGGIMGGRPMQQPMPGNSGIVPPHMQQPRPMAQNFGMQRPAGFGARPRPMLPPQANPMQPRPGGELGGIMGGVSRAPMAPPMTMPKPWGTR